jgi:hypothetical protein
LDFEFANASLVYFIYALLERRGSLRQLFAGLLAHHILGVPVGPVRISLAGALLVLPVGGLARRSALARSLAEPNEVAAESMRPGSRVVISCNSQPLPSGSRNEANER